MGRSEQQILMNFATVLEKLPADFTLVPTDKLLSAADPLTVAETKFLTFFLNMKYASYGEIADALGTNHGNVNTTLSGVMRKVRNFDETSALNLDRLKTHPQRESALINALLQGGYFTHREVARSQG